MNQNTDKLLSRRSALKAGLGFVIAGAAAGTATIVMAQTKMAPNLVLYQATPKDGHRCDACAQWVAPDGCKVVEGKISPSGWCAAFAPVAK